MRKAVETRTEGLVDSRSPEIGNVQDRTRAELEQLGNAKVLPEVERQRILGELHDVLGLL